MTMLRIPVPRVDTPTVALRGGVVSNTTPAFAPEGSASFVQNYEPAVGGGFARSGNIERFDGRPRPSDALYTLIEGAFTGVSVGNAVNGATSGATGVVSTVGSGFICVTKVVGTFGATEVVRIGATPIGTRVAPMRAVTALEDAAWREDAANRYRADIQQVPGSGPIRGLAILNNVVYAWRNNAAGTAMNIYRSTASGWQLVNLLEVVGFANANTSVNEGDTITQGGVTALVARVSVRTGTQQSGVNTGILVVSGRAGGDFTAGVATTTGGGALNLVAPQTAITLLPNGRVETDRHAFFGGAQRLYGCDGVNQEFEFDGSVYVPLATGVGTRASYVRVHKNHLFFAFGGSLQHSSIADPYQYQPITGAAEIATGGTITGLQPLAGSEVAAAMLVTCEDAAWVLYGNNAGNNNAGWQFTPIAKQSGAKHRSLVDLKDAISFDQAGALLWRPTDVFGNFIWESISDAIKPVVEGAVPLASVVVRSLGRARWFLSDGAVITATRQTNRVEWAVSRGARQVNCAVSDEIAGVSRTFYGSATNGFVWEADVGRSDDGDALESVLRLNPVSAGSPFLLKTFRWGEAECKGSGVFTMNVYAELSDQDPDVGRIDGGAVSQTGSGGRWDVDSWDEGFWDARPFARSRFAMPGQGYNASLLFYQRSAVFLPHEIRAVTIGLTGRRLTNYAGT